MNQPGVCNLEDVFRSVAWSGEKEAKNSGSDKYQKDTVDGVRANNLGSL